MRVGRAALAIGAAAALACAASASAADWAHFGGDPQVTNDVPSTAAPDYVQSAAANLQVRWTAHLDGPVIASPLYADNVSIGTGGQALNMVYVATQSGSVFAVDAYSGDVVWQRQLGTAASNCNEAQAGVASTYGIVSTGLINRARNVLYVIGANGVLHALDLGTGQDAPGWPVQVVTDTSGELVWGGLTMSGDKLYVPVASYCDETDITGAYATGRIMAVDLDTRAVVSTFQVVPDAPNSMGGIWGWGGASLDPLTGDLWAATGNSWFYDLTCGCISQTAGYSESVVQLDPNLNVLASDRPDTVPGENDDADFGSTPLLFQPPGCPPLAAAYAKTGYIYVWLRDSLASGPIWSFLGGPSDITNAFVGEPSYSSESNELIVADARTYDDTGAISHFDAVTAFAFGPGCSLPDEPTWVAPDLGRGPKAPALIVGGIAFVVGGYVPGIFALDASNGAVLWSNELPQPVLAPPAFGDDQVYVADTSGVVEAVGVGPPPPPPAPPVALTAGKAALTVARAGKQFTVSFLLRNDGDPVQGAVRCSGKLAGKPLRILRHASTASGKTSCTWTLPAGAHGKRFAGAVSATYKGSKLTRPFSTTVR